MIRAAVLLLSLLAATAAWSEDAAPRDELETLATIETVHDLCGFDLSDAQQDAVIKRRQALVDDGGVSEQDVATIRDTIGAALARQVADGLCKPQGAEARLYKRLLTELGD